MVVRELLGPEQVAPADLDAVETELPGREVEQPLDHEDAVLAARPADRRHDGLVGEDRRELAVIAGDVVGSEQRALAVDRHREPVGIVGARVVQKNVADAEDPPVP